MLHEGKIIQFKKQMGQQRVKINREVLWKQHEAIQAQGRAWNQWYENNGKTIEELDKKRQQIVQKYFRFEDGQLKVNAQQQHVLNKGMALKDYDREMEALMSGEEEIIVENPVN